MPSHISFDEFSDVLKKMAERVQDYLDKDLGLPKREILNRINLVGFKEIQNKYNNYVATHTHISPFYGITVPPSIDLQPANIEQNIGIINETIADTLEFKMGYLNKFKNDYLSSTSEFYVNSRYHHLN